MPSFWKGRREQEALGQYDQVSGDLASERGAASEGYLSKALAYDPSQAVDQYGKGFLDEAREGLGQDFESLTGSAVGSGRLRTGFFQRDAGRMFQDFNRRVANAIASQSLNASALQRQNISDLGSYGANLYGQQIDMIGGALDRSTAERNQGGGIGGFLKGAVGGLAGVAGTALAGPIGGAITSWGAGKLAGWGAGGQEDYLR